MKFMHVILAALIALCVFSVAYGQAAEGPCVDKMGATICANLKQDCTSKKWAKLIQSNCRASCGVC